MKKVSLKNILLYCILTFLFLHNVEGANRNMNKCKNIELVLSGTILKQEMLDVPNARYIIESTLNLDKKTIRVPDNCVLIFRGGALKNGEVVGQVVVEADAVQIFDDLICRELVNRSIPIEWYGGKAYKTLAECKKGQDSSEAINRVLQSNYRHKEVLFLGGYYRIDNTVTISRGYNFVSLSNKNDYNNYSEENIGSRLVFTGIGKPMFIIADNQVSFDGFNFYHGSSKDGTDCFHFSNEARTLTIKNSMLYLWRYCIYKEWDGVSRTGLNRCTFENVKFSSCIGGIFMNQITAGGNEMYYCTANYFDNCTFEYCHFGAYFISNSNFAMVEFNRCNFYKIGWGKYDKAIYDKLGCFGIRFNCGYNRSQSSHVIIRGCYFEDIVPYRIGDRFDENGEIRMGKMIYPTNDKYYSCIISENNSYIIDGCSFTNCPKYFSGDKYCSWDIRENRIFGYNMKIPMQWSNKKLLRVFKANRQVKYGNLKSTIYYSNILGSNNVILNGLVDFDVHEDQNMYRVLNCFEDSFVDFPSLY